MWLKRMNLSDQKDSKKEVLFTTQRTARRSREQAEKFDLPCPNLVTEDTCGDGGEDNVRGRREDGISEVAAAKSFVVGVVDS